MGKCLEKLLKDRNIFRSKIFHTLFLVELGSLFDLFLKYIYDTVMIYSPLAGIRGKDYRITQGFGKRKSYYKQFGLEGHDALDFAGPKAGDKVPCYSSFDGYIKKMGWSKYGYGNYIEFVTSPDKDGNIRELIYAHLDSFAPGLVVGMRVPIGDQLGIIGTTGNSTGVHLHLAMRKIDPDTHAVINEDNGFKGRFDYEPWIRDWIL